MARARTAALPLLLAMAALCLLHNTAFVASQGKTATRAARMLRRQQLSEAEVEVSEAELEAVSQAVPAATTADQSLLVGRLTLFCLAALALNTMGFLNEAPLQVKELTTLASGSAAAVTAVAFGAAATKEPENKKEGSPRLVLGLTALFAVSLAANELGFFNSVSPEAAAQYAQGVSKFEAAASQTVGLGAGAVGIFFLLAAAWAAVEKEGPKRVVGRSTTLFFASLAANALGFFNPQ